MYYDSYRDTQVVGGVQLSIPIYQGGLLASRTRQAQLEADQAKFQRLAQERAVTAKVTAAWNQVIASKLAIEASQSQVSAAATALAASKSWLWAREPRSTCSIRSRNCWPPVSA
ncbi:MAG: TolC family protein [Hyphomonadaceae bacterium]